MATKQSRAAHLALDCFASLAMTMPQMTRAYHQPKVIML
jgi:hypothetical protein